MMRTFSSVRGAAWLIRSPFRSVLERSRNPKGLTPLKMALALPSQKLSKLKTALKVGGALRGSTLRMVSRGDSEGRLVTNLKIGS
jgi:hypothetical protein